MSKFPINVSLGEGKRPIGYECRPDRSHADPGCDPDADRPNLYVVGPYTTQCGGCDAVKTQDECCNSVRTFASQGDVVFEGLLISHIFDRYHKLDHEMADKYSQHTIWAFLDTPLEVCLDRVRSRRNARAALTGKPVKEFNEKNTRDKWHDSLRGFEKCQAAKLDARWLPYTDAVETAWQWLNNK
jgi:hypothetical protein